MLILSFFHLTYAFSMIFLRSLHVVENGNIASFYGWVVVHCKYIPHLGFHIAKLLKGSLSCLTCPAGLFHYLWFLPLKEQTLISREPLNDCLLLLSQTCGLRRACSLRPPLPPHERDSPPSLLCLGALLLVSGVLYIFSPEALVLMALAFIPEFLWWACRIDPASVRVGWTSKCTDWIQLKCLSRSYGIPGWSSKSPGGFMYATWWFSDPDCFQLWLQHPQGPWGGERRMTTYRKHAAVSEAPHTPLAGD